MGQHGLLLLFKWLDVRICYGVMALVVPFYMLFSFRNYKTIYRYFRQQFGYSPGKAFVGAYKNHYRFGQIILDRFAVYAGKRHFFDVEIEGNEHFLRLQKQEKGGVMVSSHIGNYELCGYLLASDKKRINALVYAGETETVKRNREAILGGHNVSMIPVLPDMSHLFKLNQALGAGEVISMPADRLFGSKKSVTCRLLNGTASFPFGAFTLAMAHEVELLAVFVMKASAKRYKVYVRPIRLDHRATDGATKQERTTAFVQAYVNEIEKILRQYPEQWFNFYPFWNNN